MRMEKRDRIVKRVSVLDTAVSWKGGWSWARGIDGIRVLFCRLKGLWVGKSNLT
jgi:hypothetical protein